MWLVLFLIPVCFQYAMNLVNAISWQGSQRLTAVGTKIPEAPAITQAHLLLHEGKMMQALDVLTESLMQRPRALEIIARWYRVEGDYEKAVSLYQEVLEHAQEDVDFWSEAAYNLGKLYESFLDEPYKAMALFKRIADDMPESRFCSLAEADLTRLRMAYGEVNVDLYEDSAPAPYRQMDFWEQRRALLQRQLPPENPLSEAEKEDASQQEE
jgi:tetratricopeptide (TPR) repeat protein